MAPIRVLVVDDSLTIRKRLIEILADDPDVAVVGEAGDGRTAIAMCQALRPDVVTLDMMLPIMTGLAATEYIMAHCPTPILIVSASVNRGELFRTYEALAAGALDVLDKPTGEEVDGEWERKFVATVKLISRIRVITHLRAKLSSPPRAAKALAGAALRDSPSQFEVVALGASTGGPAAVRDVLTSLPHDFPLPILLVLHIAEPFAKALAEWLDGLSPLRVACAADGEPIQRLGSGRVVVAPPDAHLLVRAGKLRLSRSPERNWCRPSVDVLFESLAEEIGARAIACVLTGMGKDGADGLLAIRKAGGVCIAQDESTSVVYGMPREAALRGAAERVLPLEEIGPTLVGLSAARLGSAR
jgi:two-component system, chemotaxis family, protein-glutamate methylesterase/glutaminase